MTNPYGLDDDALILAALAFTHTAGSQAEQLHAAIAAYRFAVDARRIVGGNIITYPDWQIVEEFLITVRQGEEPPC